MATSLELACNECKHNFMTSYYACKTCSEGYTICDDCYWEKQENEEKHRHPLVLTHLSSSEAPKMLFEHQLDTPSLKGRILLSNFSPILEGPEYLSKLGIVGVLSIMDGDEIESMESLKAIYGEVRDQRYETMHSSVLDVLVRDKETDIVFYNFRVADVSNPSILSKSRALANGSVIPSLSPDQVFSRAVLFTQECLKHGKRSVDDSTPSTILVHCKQGRRRSPTSILAILVSSGMRVHKALQQLGTGYQGESDWMAGYKQHRAQWLTALNIFESKGSLQLQEFRESHPKLIKAYQGLVWNQDADSTVSIPSSNSSSSHQTFSSNISPNPKKRTHLEAKEDVKSVTKAPPAKKYKLVTNTALKPSIWASKGKK